MCDTSCNEPTFIKPKRLRNEQSYRACGIPAVNCKQYRTHLWRSCRSRVGRADSRCDRARNLYRRRANLRKILKKRGISIIMVLIHCRFYATYKYIDISSDFQLHSLCIVHRITDTEEQGTHAKLKKKNGKKCSKLDLSL